MNYPVEGTRNDLSLVTLEFLSFTLCSLIYFGPDNLMHAHLFLFKVHP